MHRIAPPNTQQSVGLEFKCINLKDLILTGGMAQVVYTCFVSHKALSSNLSLIKTNKKRHNPKCHSVNVEMPFRKGKEERGDR
jgi:hypothetical protein